MIRRGVGVSRVQQQQADRERLAQHGEQLTAARLGAVHDQLEQLEERIRRFANEHKAQIATDPHLRAEIKRMADALGIDVTSTNELSLWSKVFGGMADTYNALAARVIQYAALESRALGGAAVPMVKVIAAMRREFPAFNVSEADIEAALARTAVLGPGYLVTRGSDSSETAAFLVVSSTVRSGDVIVVLETARTMFLMAARAPLGVVALRRGLIRVAPTRAPRAATRADLATVAGANSSKTSFTCWCPSLSVTSLQEATKWPLARCATALVDALLEAGAWIMTTDFATADEGGGSSTACTRDPARLREIAVGATFFFPDLTHDPTMQPVE